MPDRPPSVKHKYFWKKGFPASKNIGAVADLSLSFIIGLSAAIGAAALGYFATDAGAASEDRRATGWRYRLEAQYHFDRDQTKQKNKRAELDGDADLGFKRAKHYRWWSIGLALTAILAPAANYYYFIHGIVDALDLLAAS